MDCAVCDKLWQAYAEATARYADFVNQQEIREHFADSEKLNQLEGFVLSAAVNLLSHWQIETSHYRDQLVRA